MLSRWEVAGLEGWLPGRGGRWLPCQRLLRCGGGCRGGCMPWRGGLLCAHMSVCLEFFLVYVTTLDLAGFAYRLRVS